MRICDCVCEILCDLRETVKNYITTTLNFSGFFFKRAKHDVFVPNKVKNGPKRPKRDKNVRIPI